MPTAIIEQEESNDSAITTTTNNTTTITSDDQNQMKNNMMIVLYYCYPPKPIPQIHLTSHSNFHTTTCTNLNLGGRIRVSEEGINGVLSGTKKELQLYEERLRMELIQLLSLNDNDDDDDDDTTKDWLDMKYCQLRTDIPINQQLFTSLNVKITREVVSLVEPSKSNKKGKSSNKRGRCKQRRKQKKKERERLEKMLLVTSLQQQQQQQQQCDNIDKLDSSDQLIAIDTDTTITNNNDTAAPHQVNIITAAAAQLALNNTSNTTNNIGTVIPIKDWETYTPAVHLSPQEWNERLLHLSQAKEEKKNSNDAANDNDDEVDDSSNNEQTNTGNDELQDHPPPLPSSPPIIPSNKSNAILLDTRNIYETRIGHFAVPNLETFFPNTRKFSSLPETFNTTEAVEALSGKDVYMYCTGKSRLCMFFYCGMCKLLFDALYS